MAAFEVEYLTGNEIALAGWRIRDPDGKTCQWSTNRLAKQKLRSQCRRLNAAYELGRKHEREGKEVA